MAQLHIRQNPFHGDGWIITVFISATPTPYRTQQTSPPNPNYSTNTASNEDNDNNNWAGTKMTAFIIPIAFISLIILGIWYFCCGGRERRRRRRAARSLPGPNTHPNSDTPANQQFQHQGIELTPVPNAHLANNSDPPPPEYAEALPPRHQTIAGGVKHVREEDESVISNGKTPLSEIPFEDVVVVSSASSESSPRYFRQAHHEVGGNTFGHTNS